MSGMRYIICHKSVRRVSYMWWVVESSEIMCHLVAYLGSAMKHGPIRSNANPTYRTRASLRLASQGSYIVNLLVSE